MRNFKIFILGGIFFIFILSPRIFAQPTEESTGALIAEKTVKAIDIQGNKTISVATILSKIKTRVGQPYNQSIISDDLKRLYNTGYFADVRVDRQDYDEGLKVIIAVEEKPIIEEITFSKTRYLRPRNFLRKMENQVGKFLDKKALNDDIELIKELYSQKGLTSAEVEAETFIDEVTNKATIHFIVRENYRIKIARINIYGNDTFPDKRIIKIIKTRSAWIFGTGYLKEDILEEDIDRIKAFYEQQGFIDATAESSIEQLIKGRINVNIQIAEGKRYFVGGITIVGNDIISDKEIQKVMAIKEGDPFSRENLSVDISGIRTLYFDRGYIFVEAAESTSLDSETGKVDIKIDIKEGQVAYLEKIKIQGNTRTRDIVVRRELNMYPGDRFDGTKLRKSKERLKDLGYFEDVGFDIEDTDYTDRKNLVVQVKEAKTGTFSFGGGYSTVDQIVGFIELEQRNFDFSDWPTFTGGGQNILLRAETGSTRNNLYLSFTEPWLFDYPVSAGFDAFSTERNRERDVGFAYDEKRVGGDIRFGKRFSEDVSGGVALRNEKTTIDNFETDVSADLLAEAGTNTVRLLAFSLSRDTRDSVHSPTKGLLLAGNFDIAGGALGGDKDFIRFQPRASYSIPLKYNAVLEFQTRMGFADAYDDSEKVPIFERFFAGGARTIRGYNERKVGPLDSATSDPLGGESIFVGNIEYTIPVIEQIKAAAFFDTGNVWAQVDDFASTGLKSGTGLGLRFKTPIGPISLDYGYPLNDEPGEESRSGKFYFSVSRGF